MGYTIPLNFYFLLSLFLSVIARYLLLELSETESRFSNNFFTTSSFLLVVSVSVGVLLSLVFYIPVIEDIFDNQYVNPTGIDLIRALKLFQLVGFGFLSRRSLLFVLLLLGLIFLFRKTLVSRENIELVFLLLLILFPFLISTLRGDNSPPRTFVNLVPIFSVFAGAVISRTLPSSKLSYLLVVLFCIQGIASFHYERHRLSSIVQGNLHRAYGPSRAQELNYSYYSYAYAPLDQIEEFLRNKDDNKILVVGDAEPNGLEEYLKALDIHFELTGLSIPDVDNRPWEGPSLSELVNKYPDGFYFVTRFPNRLFRDLVAQQIKAKIVTLSSKLTYHNFFYIDPT